MFAQKHWLPECSAYQALLKKGWIMGNTNSQNCFGTHRLFRERAWKLWREKLGNVLGFSCLPLRFELSRITPNVPAASREHKWAEARRMGRCWQLFWHCFLRAPSCAYSWILGCSSTVTLRGNSRPLHKCPSWSDRTKWHFHFSLMIPWTPWLLLDPQTLQPLLPVFPSSHYGSCIFLINRPPLAALQILSVLTMTVPDVPILACLSAGPLSWCNQNTNAYFQNVGSCWKSR